MKLMSKKCLGPKSCLWPNNGHAKRANLITKWHLEEVPGVTNKQYHSKELNQGISVVFFSFGTALAIEKIGFQFSLHFLLETTKVPTRGRYNGHAKTATLTKQLQSHKVCDVYNEQYHSKELNQGSSLLFFSSFGTALVIEKIKFENFSYIPTWYYIKRLLATAGPAVEIQILEISTASQEISNEHNLCYRYPPELKPSAK
jgi:hypothetical protein